MRSCVVAPRAAYNAKCGPARDIGGSPAWLRARCSVIATVRTEPAITEFLGHEGVPEVAKSREAAALIARVGESESRLAGDDDVKRVERIAARSGRVGQIRNKLVETKEGVRVAMGRYQGKRRGTLPLFANERGIGGTVW